VSISNYAENAMLDALFNNAALQKANRYVKLHTGDPGEAGTTNAATETTRKSVTGAAAAAGTFTSVNDLVWTNVAGSETYSHISIWDDVAAGNCLWTGALTAAKAVNAGDTFTIATGALTVSVD
jgi:hypothetical protein